MRFLSKTPRKKEEKEKSEEKEKIEEKEKKDDEGGSREGGNRVGADRHVSFDGQPPTVEPGKPDG